MSIEDRINAWAIPRGTSKYRGMEVPATYWDLQEQTIDLAREQAKDSFAKGNNTLSLLQVLLNTLLVASGTPYSTTPEIQAKELLDRLPQDLEKSYYISIIQAITNTHPHGPKIVKLIRKERTAQTD